jgi:Flp pilus assembly protein TadD
LQKVRVARRARKCDFSRVFPASRKRLLLLLVLVAVGGVSLWLGRAPFRHWQERRLVEKARTFLKNGDLRSAYLSSREALLNNPRSVAACSIIARITDLDQSPAAIFWRQQLADLQPGSSGPLLDLAETATRFGETFIAEQAMTRIPEADRHSVAFRQVSAGLAVAFKQFAVAEAEFQKALELDPANEGLQLSLATVRIALARPGQVEEARAVLETLRTKPRFRAHALRALITEARAHGDPARAMQLAGELRQDAQATIDDQMLYLEELQRAESKDFLPELSKLQALAGTKPEFIYGAMTWMNAHGLAAQSLEWSTQLKPDVRGRLPVPLALAEACTIRQDWKRLGKLIIGEDWENLEFLRCAIHARLLRETSARPREADFTAMWERAMNATRGNPNSLAMLARLVSGWGWKDEATQVWWLAARDGPARRAALKALYVIHEADRNTRELYRVARRVYEMEPANPVAKNNVAALALLLGEDEAEAHRLAAELYQLTPAQPVIASTYAMSLHRQKRDSDALAILRQLPPAALADPSIAALYGFLLAQNGDPQAARPFLEAADKQRKQLFPEEEAMVAGALKGLP